MSTLWPDASDRPRWLWRVLLVALAYLALARLGLLFALGKHITLLWLPTGLAVAALWRWGPTMWWGVLLGVAATLLSRDPIAWGTWPFLIGNTLAPCVAVWLLRRLKFDSSFNQRHHVPALVLAAIASMAISAGVGVTTLWVVGVLDATRAVGALARWWIGDAVGMLLLAPPLLLMARRHQQPGVRQVPRFEWVACLSLAMVSGAMVFLASQAEQAAAVWLHGPLEYLPFLLLAWLAARTGQLFYPSVAVLVLAVMAAFGTSRGLGPFGADSGPLFALAHLWGYVISLQLVVLSLGTLASEADDVNERLRGLFETSRDAILISYPDGPVRFANPAAERLFGLSQAEICTRRRHDLLDLTDPRVAVAAAERVASGSVHGVVRARRGDGELFEAELQVSTHTGQNGRGLLYVAMSDVSERLAAEQALRASEERLRMALTGGAVGLWEWDIDRDSVRSDERSCVLYGLPLGQELDAGSFRNRVHPQDREALMTAMNEALRQRTPFTCEYRIILPDGQARWLHARGQRVADDAGMTHRMSGTVIDVTERRQAAEAMVYAEAALRASQAKTEFLSSMSHELRTPLNAILGFAQILASGVGRTDEQRQRTQIKHIETAGWHLLAMIDDILDLSRIESGHLALKLGPVALPQAVQKAVSLIENAAGKRGISVQVAPIAAQAIVQADPVRLRQVLSNLLSNAVKYNREGGRIEIAATRDGQLWRIAIEDTGLGMDAKQLSHLFEPFNRLGRADGAIEGTGIGLVITRRLIEAMHGELQVRSTPGKGSCFTVTLPIPQEAITLPASVKSVLAGAAVHQQDHARPGSRVLYVEDNAVNAVIVEEALSSAGVTVRVAANAASGLAMAQQWHPHLILLDMALPDEHGLELRRKLLADPQLRHVPCMALTAQATAADREAARSWQFEAYIVKPFDVMDLRATVLASLESTMPAEALSP